MVSVGFYDDVEAMDDVEHQINLAESFLAEAKVKAEAASNH